ncbi:MAG: hypothetical protein ABJE95_08790 [Byssovorax sp.]
MKHRLATSLAVSMFFASAGCALLAGVDGERHIGQETATSTASSTSSSGTGGSGGQAPVCSLALPPTPPTTTDAGGADVLTFALREVDLGGPKKKVGFDLDGQCTCAGKTGCQEPVWAEADHCDDPDGRDNGAGNAFATINAAFGAVISSVQLSDQAYKGKWSVLVKLSGYNGGDDDDQVEVALYTTPGTGAFTPKWDGMDAWPVAPTSLLDSMSLDMPVEKDPKAYVTNRVLVAHLPTATVVFQGSGVHLEFKLSSAIFSATLAAKDTGAVELTAGTLSGSWTEPELFKSLSGLRVNGGMNLCIGDTYYHPVKKALCDEIDLSSTGKSSDPCDALSFSVGFEASPAMLMGVVAFDPLSGACDPAKDPATDLCGS